MAERGKEILTYPLAGRQEERQRRPATIYAATCVNVDRQFSKNKTNFVNMKGIRCPRCMLSLLGPRPV